MSRVIVTYPIAQTFSAGAVNQAIYQVIANTDRPVAIHDFTLAHTTHVGDAGEKLLQLEIRRGTPGVSHSGGLLTGQPIEDGGVNASVGVNRNVSMMSAGSGTIEVLESFSWALRLPLRVVYHPRRRPIVSPEHVWELRGVFFPSPNTLVKATLTLEVMG